MILDKQRIFVSPKEIPLGKCMQYACMAVKHVMCNGQENKRKIPHIGGDFSAPGKSSSIFPGISRGSKGNMRNNTYRGKS
jgi:hypothetical protein